MSTDQNIRPPAYHSTQPTEDVARKLAKDLGSPIEDVRQALGIGSPGAASAPRAKPAKPVATAKPAPKRAATKRSAPKAKRKAGRGR